MATRSSKKPKLPYSLVPYKDGWRCHLSLGADSFGNRRHPSKVFHGSERECHRQAALWAAEMAAAPPEAPGRELTLREWAETWCKEHGRGLAVRTRQSYGAHLDNHILPMLGSLLLTEITPKHVAVFLAFLASAKARLNTRATHLSGATQLSIYRTLSIMLTAAVQRYLIPSNPADAVKRPKKRKKAIQHYDSLEQLTAALKALQTAEPRFKAIVYLALMTGMRRGELNALRWQDIDFDAGVITVTQSAVCYGGLPRTTKAPKSDAGVRVIGLPNEAMEPLRAWKFVQMMQAMTAGDRWRDTEGYICTTDGTGKWMSADTLTRQWSRFVAARKLPPLTLHGLRHTYASLQVDAGVDIGTISKALGHAQQSTTLNNYSHPQREAVQRAAQTINATIIAALAHEVAHDDEK